MSATTERIATLEKERTFLLDSVWGEHDRAEALQAHLDEWREGSGRPPLHGPECQYCRQQVTESEITIIEHRDCVCGHGQNEHHDAEVDHWASDRYRVNPDDSSFCDGCVEEKPRSAHHRFDGR